MVRALVDYGEASAGGKRVEELGADHPVTDRGVAAASELSAGTGGITCDNGVLVVRFRQPWIDRTVCNEPVERVAFDEDAVSCGGQARATQDLPAPGGPVTVRKELTRTVWSNGDPMPIRRSGLMRRR